MTEEFLKSAYCPQCGQDFKVAVNETDEVVILCNCEVQLIREFAEELEEQLPIEVSEVEKINKKKSDSEGSRGFQ